MLGILDDDKNIYNPHLNKTYNYPHLKTMQVKLELSHHERDGEGSFKSAKPLCFVLDQVPEAPVKTEKKKKSPTITTKNFGAYVSIPSVKNSDNIFLAWRCRLLVSSNSNVRITFSFKSSSASKHYYCSQSFLPLMPRLDSSSTAGGKVLMPIRPVVCLKHQLEVTNETVCLV